MLPEAERVGAEAVELGGGGGGGDYLVLFEGGFTLFYQYTMLIRFTVDTAPE